MAARIDRGLDLVEPEQEAIRGYVEVIQEIAATLDPAEGWSASRASDFDAILARLDGAGGEDPTSDHMSSLMHSFRAGLFVGGDAMDAVRDDLELERWFRLPKAHERRIHGHRHAGVRIVQEGPTMLLALDAHVTHPGPFDAADLVAYRSAREPECQRQALSRRTVMRKARSKTERPKLLAELERQYLAASSSTAAAKTYTTW